MLTLYRDGVPVATANATGVISPSTGSLQIGGSHFGEYFKGLIDEVRIYKTALSDTEIQTIYQQESIGISSTVAAPLISPNGGSYSDAVSVTMQTATSGASIYYTTDGSTPTQSSTLYSGSMTLTSSKIVKAKALKSGYNGKYRNRRFIPRHSVFRSPAFQLLSGRLWESVGLRRSFGEQYYLRHIGFRQQSSGFVQCLGTADRRHGFVFFGILQSGVLNGTKHKYYGLDTGR